MCYSLKFRQYKFVELPPILDLSGPVVNNLPKITNTVNGLQYNMAIAEKRIPVTKETLEKLKKLGHKGQTYDELLNEMMEAYRKEKFIKMLNERREEGNFVDFDEAF